MNFKLKWRNVTHGWEMETRYYYTGTDNQRGYTFHGWLCRCIAFGKREGFQYLGKA